MSFAMKKRYLYSSFVSKQDDMKKEINVTFDQVR